MKGTVQKIETLSTNDIKLSVITQGARLKDVAHLEFSEIDFNEANNVPESDENTTTADEIRRLCDLADSLVSATMTLLETARPILEAITTAPVSALEPPCEQNGPEGM
jgi:hypothetical protein